TNTPSFPQAPGHRAPRPAATAFADQQPKIGQSAQLGEIKCHEYQLNAKVLLKHWPLPATAYIVNYCFPTSLYPERGESMLYPREKEARFGKYGEELFNMPIVRRDVTTGERGKCCGIRPAPPCSARAGLRSGALLGDVLIGIVGHHQRRDDRHDRAEQDVARDHI